MNILRFLEEDRGVVSSFTMMFIPKEKRWSALNRTERLSADFVTEKKCQEEATTGIAILARKLNTQLSLTHNWLTRYLTQLPV